MLPPAPELNLSPSLGLEGDPESLATALGAAAGLPALGRSLAFHHPHTPTHPRALRGFLLDYRQELLIPLELPAIQRAFNHAWRYEVRELLAFDRHLPAHRFPRQFAFASQVTGRRYLRRLRPLRDVRLIRRYLHAIQRGQAFGWHTLVYGAVLTVYSLPLRQGLLGYARQTLGGFIDTASRHLYLPASYRADLARELWADVPPAIDRLLAATPPTLRLLP